METQYVLSQTKQGKKEWIPLPTGGVAPHNQAWSTITDTPTTLLGYGITDGGGAMEWPGAGIPLSTGASPWGTSYTTSGSGTVLALINSPAFTGTVTVERTGGAASIKATSASSGAIIMDGYNTGIAALNYYTAGDVILAFGGGMVGIGTNAPAVPLHIKSSTSDAGIYIIGGETNDLSKIVFTNKAAPNTSYTWITADGKSTGYLSLTTGDSERLRIDKDGNVGIGTTSPTQKLHIVGNGIITGSLMVYSS